MYCDLITPHSVFLHYTTFLQLPDLRYLDCRVDFSSKTFRAVVDLCKDLGIRYPEELSLCKPLEQIHLKKNYSEFPKRKFYTDQNGYLQPAPDTNTFIPNSNGLIGSSHSLDNRTFSCAPVHSQSHNGTLNRSAHSNGTPISSPTGVS